MRLKPRQIESWFIALGLLDQRQKAWNDFDNHLRDILKDGSILCRLVNRIKPGSINQIYQSPVSDDQRLDNVHSFLNACQYLQLKENEIFSPTDLDSADGFQRVLRTLDCLENVATGYGLGKQFTKHHELTETDLTQDTEEESKEDKKLLEMTDYGGGIHLVKATFPFSGRDDDELCFERGDILEVTKVVDGGWWEGTLNGKVGWFPSNYVKEISASPEPTTPVTPQPSTLSASKRESVRVYHNLVVQNILDTERAHVSELQALLQNYLKPLQGSNVLPAQDMRVLAGNFEEIVQFQQMFFHIMDECAHLSLPQQRMGASYLQLAPQMKELYVNYCANHPRAVEVLTKYSDELSAFIESKGAPSPGILTLTTSLSKPFRHLDKYPNHMKELERHLEEGHVDELDTKKAIAVFQNLATSCHETRKRKETELEMLTGTIEGWEDEDISKQGDLYLMSQFLIHGENGEVRERSFLLFPNCLIILSVNANACGYCFEKKYDISELTVRSLEDSEGILNAFEIKVNEDVMKLSTNHAHEKVSWLEALQPSRQSQRIRQHSPHSDKGSVTSPSPWVERQPVSMSERMFTKSSPPRSYSTGSPPSSATPKSSLSTSGVHSQSSSEGSKFRSMSASHSVNTDLTAMSSAPQSPHRKGHWDFTRLRPTPPLRPAYALIAKEDTSTAHRSMRGLLHPSRKKQGRSKSELDDDKHSTSGSCRVLEEDMLILRVVEAYCTSARARHTVNSSPILPELPSHRPSSFSSLKGDVWKRKSKKKFSRDVAGEFNCLRRRVEELQLETESLKQSLLEEQRARKKMEKFIRCSLKGVIPDFKWDDIDDS